MKRIMLSIISLLAIFGCENPTDDYFVDGVSFSIDESELPDSLLSTFWEEANRIVYRNAIDGQNDFIDSVIIPQKKAQIYYQALVQIYNYGNQENVERLFKGEYIYFFHDLDLHNVIIKTDSAETWTSSWIQGGANSGYIQIDSLCNLYGLEVVNTMQLSEWNYFVLTSETMLNTRTLCQLFESIPEIERCFPDSWAGDGDRIYGEISGNSIFIDIKKRWGDCPGGCIHEHVWRYRVTYKGDVRLISSYGDDVQE